MTNLTKLSPDDLRGIGGSAIMGVANSFRAIPDSVRLSGSDVADMLEKIAQEMMTKKDDRAN